ncbi:hypothetical protein AOQ84DRAFT_68771 [Glonium stellatum]|uniref:Uncharacterized protein n=1 Tax=Glonium stellatum TaxID=574774 RepID=A0A8E2EY52_9PEZI|nr:hypothetical protein AOQ84DRAFT_68771 [Glonium stellatum]
MERREELPGGERKRVKGGPGSSGRRENHFSFFHAAPSTVPALTPTPNLATAIAERDAFKRLWDDLRARITINDRQYLQNFSANMESKYDMELPAKVEKLEQQIATLKTDLDNQQASNADYYNKVATLQEQSDSKDKTIREHENQIRKQREEIEYHQSSLNEANSKHSELKGKHDALQRELDNEKDQVEKDKDALADIQTTLNKLQADITQKDAENIQIRKDADNWMLRCRESEEKLESLQQEWSEQQDQASQLEEDLKQLGQLQAQYDELEREVTEHRELMEEKDNEISVKDARIQRLETELQKAMAQSIAAAGSATAISSSLEEEMSAIGEDLGPEPVELQDADTQTDLPWLEQSTIYTTLDQEPIDPHVPELHESGVITTCDVEPIVPELSTSLITSTLDLAPIEPPVLDLEESGILVSAEVEPFVPALSRSLITATLDLAPVAAPVPRLQESGVVTTAAVTPIDQPAETLTTAFMVAHSVAPADSAVSPTQPPQHPQPLQISSVTTLLDSSPIATATPPAARVRTAVTSKKPSLLQKLLPYLCIFFMFTTFYVYAMLCAWSTANTSSLGRGQAGAFGSNSNFLGVIPIGWDIGESALAENMVRMGAGWMQMFEDWAEVDRSLLY